MNTQKASWEDEFDRKFTTNLIRTFFGDPDELRKQGWEVGGNSELIIKQNLDVNRLKAFIKKNFVHKDEVREKVTRVEVIDENGRSYTNWNKDNSVELSFQDDDRTLKVFVRKLKSLE